MRLSFALLTLLVAAGLALPYSAKPNALKAAGNIPTVLTQNGLTTLVDLVTKAGLAEALSGAGPFTVFAPTNEAFGELDPATLKAVQMDVNLLKRVLTYHVVGSALPSADIKSELTPKTLAGESLRINVYGNDVTVNGALRVKTLETTNGIVYVIDKVIIPPEAESDIAQVLEKKKEFSTLLTAIKVAGLTDTVKSAGPFTLFAPTDAAFKALPAGALDSLIADPDKLKKVLLNHVVSGTVYSRGLPQTADVEVVGGDKVKVLVSTRGVSINKAKVTEADIYATNGVIHVVDEVILPETKAAEPVSSSVIGNIPAVLSQNGFSTLVDMVVKAELAEALSGPGPFTVFAPTNEAFANVDVSTLKALQMDVNLLKRVLTHHVVGSEISPASVKSEATPKTLAGDSLRINTYGKDVTINGALRLKSLEASNGIIYSIDKVLVPDDKERDIAEVLEKTGEFSTLLTALKVAGLKDTIKSTGPFTLFAPTDTAFKALPAGALDSLISNPEELKKVLLNHVASGTVYSRGLPPSGDVEVVGGGKVPVDVSSRGVKIGSAQVTEADIYASNGVIHVVNSVILPESPKVTQKDSASAPAEVKNIPKLLTENGQTTLVDLVVKAGLAETLSGPGPFTVFAPTNAAFDAIDPATLKSLLMDVSLLKRVLLDHVVDSAVPASAVKNDLTTKSISCRQLRLNVYGSKVTVNGALRLKTLEASNGVIHVIDKVIIPGDNNVDIPKLLEKKGGFTTLLSALKTTGLDKTLESDGPFTLLAPNDEAFKALPAGALDSLVANPAELKKTLLSHVLGGTAYSRGLSNGKINLARGGSVPVLVNQRDGVKISDAKVIEADISASNGVVHVIDRVI